MKLRKSKRIFLLPLLLCTMFSAYAQNSVRATLDSTHITMGSMTMLKLEVAQDKDAKGYFPILRDAYNRGYVGVCGDSIELRTTFKSDTTELGTNRIQVSYTVPVQSFDSGFYRLPEFIFVCGRDTSRSNRVTLKVLPVNVANDEISDYHDVAEPNDKSIFDNIPDWLLDYWWLILAILLLIALTIWALIRYRTKGVVLPKQKEPTPYEVAIWQLNNLKKKQLWENGREKEYFTELTEIVRVYLQNRFGINAMEMTTHQIVNELSSNNSLKSQRKHVGEILEMADFVKFAKVRPLPDDNREAFENALKFVEETKPVPEEESEEEDELPEEKGGEQ